MDVFIHSTNVYIEKLLNNITTELKSIESSYDKASGSYNEKAAKETSKVKWVVIHNEPQRSETSIAYNEVLNERCNIFKSLNPKTIFEVGCGEFTTLMPIVSATKPIQYGGLDLSLNRLLAGYSFFENELKNNTLFIKANAENIPLGDKTVDLVFTSHCLEWMPEESRHKALSEIMRVSARYVVLTEPAYDTAHWLQRYRNKAIGYIRDLPERLADFSDYEVVSKPILTNHLNPFNRTEAYVLKRKQAFEPLTDLKQAIACPNCKNIIEIFSQNTICNICNLAFLAFKDIPILDVDCAHYVSPEFVDSRN